jgi:hypothetical protein
MSVFEVLANIDEGRSLSAKRKFKLTHYRKARLEKLKIRSF